MLESQLRDLIAEDITKLEEGLILLNKEQFIPNPLGTKGFIDLYAKDRQGNHVLIELKRSDAAAREAMHEVYKYVEGVKSHLGVKDNEIKVIVASTEWRELIVPFSRFVSDTKINVKGLQIVQEDCREIKMAPVDVLPISEGRFIAPWHNMCWYLNEDTLKEGILSMENSCKVKGIKDYVIVVFQLIPPMISEKQMTMYESIAQMAQLSGLEMKEDAILPSYEYIAYFVMQTLSKEKCLQILSVNKDAYEEAQEIVANADDESLHMLHESVVALDPFFQTDFYEIGYPAKFNKYIETAECRIQEIKRYGIFRRNKLLDDATIISEIKGEDGRTGQVLKRTIDISNRAQIASVRSDIKRCLEDNLIWKNHILRCIDEIENEYPKAKINLYIFNPATGVFTPYFVVTREQGELYIPSYYLEVYNPEHVRTYYGGCDDNGQALTFNQVIDKYYDGNLGSLLMSMTWGGKDSRDIDIMEDLGCIYRTFRYDLKDSNPSFFVLRDERWRPCDFVDPIELYYKYLEKNKKLIEQIIGKIFPRDNFGIIDGSPSVKVWDEIADVNKGEQQKEYFINPPEECDLCKCELAKEKYMIDGKMRSKSAWAFMCQDCAVYFGAGIGWGIGQLYLNQGGRWLLVGGFDDEG